YHEATKLFPSFSVIKNILKSSLPIGAGLIFVGMYDRIDVLLIEKIIDLRAVAIYSVAYSLYRNSSVFSSLILVRAYTDLSESFSANGIIEFSYIKSTLKKLLIFCVMLLALFCLIPQFLIEIFYGKAFIVSSNLLSILAFGIPAMFLNNFTGVILNSVRREKIPMFTTAFAVLINISLNLMLIPKYGVFGAVLTTIITETFLALIQFFFIMKINSELSLFQHGKAKTK
ncbi:MAG: polysaccharide biosynthesis C-terminal domain-containing protein, partial [Ignavibacteria bacterium]|nr:polysaccharide biosynthesis C-terminal domain-containing protein [Ignavibacteria bacterium]